MDRNSFRTGAVLVSALAVATLAAGCSSSKSLESGTTAATTTTVAPATTTTAPPATDAPTTTAAETTTTVAATTTTAPAASGIGWTQVDPATLPGPLAFPCCASNWTGLPSPALPSAGGTLADGIYPIRFDWPTDFSQPATATISRFELCSVLPAGRCEDNSGGVYLDDELGVDDTATFQAPIVFDDQLQVRLGGFAGWDAPGFAAGNGIDLASLVVALDADYRTAILEPYLAGATTDEIATALSAAPAHGFAAPAEPGAGALVYTHDGSPPLLFQGLTGFDDTPEDTRGSDIIGRIALVVSGGRMTLNLYSGFYS